MGSIHCSQHYCAECNRSTADAGGMLFRCVFSLTSRRRLNFARRSCQTCPSAFCEDCLPPGDIDAVGPTIPELYASLLSRVILVNSRAAVLQSSPRLRGDSHCVLHSLPPLQRALRGGTGVPCSVGRRDPRERGKAEDLTRIGLRPRHRGEWRFTVYSCNESPIVAVLSCPIF